MDIGPIIGIRDSLTTPRRIEGISAPHFEIGASARTGDDRRPPRQYATDPGMSDDDDVVGSEADQEQAEFPGGSILSPRGPRINFVA